jgi:hypothetical protein
MSTTKKASEVDQSTATIMEQITMVANRMKRLVPTKLTLSNGDEHKLDDSALARFAEGADLKRKDWDMLGMFLVRKRVPAFDFCVCDDKRDQRFQLLPSQKLFQLCGAFNDLWDDSDLMSWYIHVVEGSSTKIRTFAVRRLYGNPHTELEEAKPRECDIWKLSVETHLVRSNSIRLQINH